LLYRYEVQLNEQQSSKDTRQFISFLLIIINKKWHWVRYVYLLYYTYLLILYVYYVYLLWNKNKDEMKKWNKWEQRSEEYISQNNIVLMLHCQKIYRLYIYIYIYIYIYVINVEKKYRDCLFAFIPFKLLGRKLNTLI